MPGAMMGGGMGGMQQQPMGGGMPQQQHGGFQQQGGFPQQGGFQQNDNSGGFFWKDLLLQLLLQRSLRAVEAVSTTQNEEMEDVGKF